MRTVNLQGKRIIATCAYCGSDNVGMTRSPVWNDGEWQVPNEGSGLPYTRTLFQYERGDSIESQYSRAYCLTCTGDTRLMFKTLREDHDLFEPKSKYIANVMERIPIGNDGGYDCVYFDREFESMDELDQELSIQLWDRNCVVKISKIMEFDTEK